MLQTPPETPSDGSGRPPIDDYFELTSRALRERLPELSAAELRALREFERRNANRQSVLDAIDEAL